MKNRVDSAHIQTAIAEKAMKKINPPTHMPLPESARPIFDSITRARLEWTQIDLVMAVNLACIFADIIRLKADVSAEGYVLDGRINPKAELAEKLTRTSLAMCRSLNIHANATVGAARDQAKKNSAYRRAQEALSESDDSGDDLIARPTEH